MPHLSRSARGESAIPCGRQWNRVVAVLIVGCWLSARPSFGIALVDYTLENGFAAGALQAIDDRFDKLYIYFAGKSSVSGKDLPTFTRAELDGLFPPTYDRVLIENPDVADIGRGTSLAQDGKMAIGYLDDGPDTPFHAFYWTQNSGIIDIGTLDPANNTSRTSFANGVSDDGSVIVGYSTIGPGGYNHAFRWTASGGMVPLDPAANDSSNPPQSLAYGVSSDGTTIVGQRNFRAFRWSESSDFQSLGNTASFANAASGDGSVIVGQTTNGQAFRWTAAGGVAPLGTLSGDLSSIATAVSDDGNVVVGISSTDFLGRSGTGNALSFNAQLSRAFYWTPDTGMLDLSALLTQAGAELDGGKLAAALGISADGKWFGGAFVLPSTPSGTTHPAFATLSFVIGLSGDYNHNGAVDAADYTVWRDSFGLSGPDLAADGSGPDGVPDSIVDSYDYELWKLNYGNSNLGSAVAVPEPSTILLVGCLIVAGIVRRGAGNPRALAAWAGGG